MNHCNEAINAKQNAYFPFEDITSKKSLYVYSPVCPAANVQLKILPSDLETNSNKCSFMG